MVYVVDVESELWIPVAEKADSVPSEKATVTLAEDTQP
jgi:hypothetical protein